MGRIGCTLAWALVAGTAGAEVRLERTLVSDRWWGGAEVTLELDGPAPWRVGLLDGPPRLVVEVEGALGPGLLVDDSDNAGPGGFASDARGWGRVEVVLDGPMTVEEAGLSVRGRGATVRVALAAADPARFAEAVSAAPVAELGLLSDAAATRADGRFVVAIDPGHGGVDPGAERGGATEAALMLALAFELERALTAAGIEVALTRREDRFVPLAERMTRARAAGADALLSLHADALEADEASGASVYTLAPGARDEASRRLAERHGGADLIAGLDLGGQDAAVALALLELARRETAPASARLAEELVAGLSGAGARVNARPRREAELAVLAAADFPSVLLETGFLSDPGDRARLSTPEGRAPLVAGIVAALLAWEAAEAAR